MGGRDWYEGTEECMVAVMQDGMNLEYVMEQIPKICKAAVKQNEDALQFVKKQILLTIMKNGGIV